MSEETRGELVGHYDRLAPRFLQHWRYNSGFITWMTGRIRHHTALAGRDRLLDVGSGPALYARHLAAHTTTPVVCAGPSPQLLARIPLDPRLVRRHATAEELADGQEEWDVILLKESMHHVPRHRRRSTLAGLARQLAPGGRLVVIMLAPQLGHPLFSAARERFETAHFTPEAASQILTDCGLQVALHDEQHTVTMPTEKYLAMVADRYMSLLTHFDDGQLNAGIAEIRHDNPCVDITFNDHYVAIVARKPPGHRRPHPPAHTPEDRP
ncbi:class I SAM-dependent methyltransferase [Saccharopolyspora indica]|uniref:class I SAM-dependent methyltransferase n=1 Tax=Saccharopolyspora indica TaxID=1229659 RepID=UPI0022EA1DD6|nr:class I SAM-dependent methyltransferase [Saccharopolyspora indica]MDA3644334.1 class I SAM-dependent methyltransferase [Saccharopolyspora indica]